MLKVLAFGLVFYYVIWPLLRFLFKGFIITQVHRKMSEQDIRSKQAATCVLKAPKKEGRYRLFLTVSDGEKIAYCNFPFYVQPSEAPEDQPMVRFKKTTLSSFENE